MTSKRRKPIGPKRRAGNGPRTRRVVAGSRDSVRQLQRERDEALEQQAATSEILSVISRSPVDVQPVLDTIVRAAVKLCNSYDAVILLRDNDRLRIAAHHGPIKIDFTHGPINRDWVSGRCVVDRVPVHVHDLAVEGAEFPLGRDISLRLKQRTVLAVPFLRDGEAIGSLTMRRQEVLPFSEKQIALLRTFSAQAVIAIENTRLLTELRESLEQQTATSDVLRVISSSPGELGPVFQAMLANAVRICEAKAGNIYRWKDGTLRLVTTHNTPAGFAEFLRRTPLHATANNPVGRMQKTKSLVHTADLAAQRPYIEKTDPAIVAAVDLGSIRTQLSVPLLKQNEFIGAITLWREEVRPFDDKQIALVQSFAAQAVIAIENTRLLNELRESLQQQTATADVLKVINRSTFDLTMVLEALVNSAARLCRAEKANIALLRGDIVDYVAQVGFPPDFLKYMQSLRLKLQRGSISGRAALEGKIIHVPDVLADPEYVLIDAQRVGGFRTALGVPMMREGTPIGTMFLSRATVEPFTQQQIELVTTFADQAVIAIENTRLLNELRESLEQQTATSDVLSVISSSPSALEPVFESVLANAVRICQASFGFMHLFENGAARIAAMLNVPEAFAAIRRRRPLFQFGSKHPLGRVVATKMLQHILDARTDEAYFERDGSSFDEFTDATGARTLLFVPLLKENKAVGSIGIYRCEVRPFTDKQIALVSNFAAQAVIAIENARLLSELRQRTTDLSESLEQQTASSNVLEVISRSAFDLKAVFETVAESSVRLCGADRAFIWRFDGELLRMVVAFNSPQALTDFISQNPVRPGRGGAVARAALERRPVHIPDVLADPEYTYGSKDVEAIRTVLGVPILKGDELLGAMTIYHLEGVRPFTDKQIALVETFADQAAIAIDNFRLLDELRHRTDELGRSVSELQALGEVSQAVNSTLDLETVLSTIVAKSVELSGTNAGAIYGYDEYTREFRLRATHGMDQELIEALTQRHIDLNDPTVAEIFAQREPTQVADLREEPVSEINEITLRGGYRARMAAPLLSGEDIVGLLVVRRRATGKFPKNTVDIIKTFAAQSALAIQNARLFHEIEDKGRQLEIASQHKSQFLANMSHELRTPLNAILGYTELMADGAYGEPSEKMIGILQRLEANGRHLLGLINDVLDLSKIEAGQLELELSDYCVQDIAQTVRSTLEPLAADKKLAFKLELAPGLPPGHGDGRRLTQVLINLVGNAIKFTDVGEVAIKAEANNGAFHVSVRDTGPGISVADQAKLFQEFQQADNAITRKKGGTGLGLAISKRIIEMHGGKIWVESQPSQGSTFAFTLPVIVERQVEPA